ncbi:MAG: hypothetical protein Q8O00_06305 [Holophaga sp.]|nr:hypothetical protein [Holophaga sp.]
MKSSILLASLLLTTSIACLAPKLKADFETKLSRWVGHSVTNFINANKLPDETIDRPGGGKTYVFAYNSNQKGSVKYTEYTSLDTGARVELTSGEQPTGWVRDSQDNRVIVKDTSVSTQFNKYCRVVLDTNAEGRILTARYEGNDCW